MVDINKAKDKIEHAERRILARAETLPESLRNMVELLERYGVPVYYAADFAGEILEFVKLSKFIPGESREDYHTRHGLLDDLVYNNREFDTALRVALDKIDETSLAIDIILKPEVEEPADPAQHGAGRTAHYIRLRVEADGTVYATEYPGFHNGSGGHDSRTLPIKPHVDVTAGVKILPDTNASKLQSLFAHDTMRAGKLAEALGAYFEQKLGSPPPAPPFIHIE
ncbi:MAG: hypothetical protein GC136_00040 [Alphaproteobacteria bacterium]|nr:hypothetical protein [Alphaproteobacteria bacterium]